MMDVDSNSVDDRARRATSVLSMDDIEAAQALEGLRSGEFCYLHMQIEILLADPKEPMTNSQFLSLWSQISHTLLLILLHCRSRTLDRIPFPLPNLNSLRPNR